MDTHEAYEEGYSNGYGIGQENRTDFTDHDAYMEACLTHEQDTFRQYSPFEFFAHDINELGEEGGSEECWEAYDRGVADGLDAAWNEPV